MTNLNILIAFEIEINKIDDYAKKPKTDDSLYWINQAVLKFIKLRFNGDLIHKTAFEQTEKRREDLIKLYTSKEYTTFEKDTDNVDFDKYIVEYPKDFLYVSDESAVITDLNNNNAKSTHIFECTEDSFMPRVVNSLTDFHYNRHYARPLRIRNNNGCVLLTDKKYKIKSYTLGYLKIPNKIQLDNPFDEYEDFSDSVMHEIIKIAAQMYLENTQDKRYESITTEVNTQE